MRTTPLLAAALLLGAAARPAAAAASEAPPPRAPAAVTEPQVGPTLAWLATQLLPSPELWIDARGARLGARWQVTPLLYSFHMNPRLSPWRSLVAEPVVRHAGSVELFASPEYLAGRSPADHWLLRGGLRAYFPLLQRGEYLSCSLGGSAFSLDGHTGASYEAGLYTLFGVVGAQVTYTPTAALRSTTLTLNLRYF